MTTLLEDVQLTLENDSRWHRWCHTNKNLTDAPDSHWKNALVYFYGPAGGLRPPHRDHLRRYFKWRYMTDQLTPPPEYTEPPPKPTGWDESEQDGQILVVKHRATSWLDPTPPPEKLPMATKLTFKTVFLLNGVDLNGALKEDIYAAISTEEKRLDKLREIKHQPKALIAEIEAGEAALKALVEHLDTAN